MEKKRFNIDLDASAFTKERTPLKPQFHPSSSGGQSVSSAAAPPAGQPLSYAEYIVQSKNHVAAPHRECTSKLVTAAGNSATTEVQNGPGSASSALDGCTTAHNRSDGGEGGALGVKKREHTPMTDTGQKRVEGQRSEPGLSLGPKPVGSGSSIIVSPRQRGNPILKFVRSVPWEFGEVVPDYVLGQTTCALFLRFQAVTKVISEKTRNKTYRERQEFEKESEMLVEDMVAQEEFNLFKVKLEQFEERLLDIEGLKKEFDQDKRELQEEKARINKYKQVVDKTYAQVKVEHAKAEQLMKDNELKAAQLDERAAAIAKAEEEISKAGEVVKRTTLTQTEKDETDGLQTALAESERKRALLQEAFDELQAERARLEWEKEETEKLNSLKMVELHMALDESEGKRVLLSEAIEDLQAGKVWMENEKEMEREKWKRHCRCLEVELDEAHRQQALHQQATERSQEQVKDLQADLMSNHKEWQRNADSLRSKASQAVASQGKAEERVYSIILDWQSNREAMTSDFQKALSAQREVEEQLRSRLHESETKQATLLSEKQETLTAMEQLRSTLIQWDEEQARLLAREAELLKEKLAERDSLEKTKIKTLQLQWEEANQLKMDKMETEWKKQEAELDAKILLLEEEKQTVEQLQLKKKKKYGFMAAFFGRKHRKQKTSDFGEILRYHNLNPNYIHERLKQLGQTFTLRVLLVQVDVKDPHHSLKELARMCIMADCTLILAWSPEEAGRYLETYKSYEKKPADLLKEQVEKDYLSKVTDCLTTVKSINKTDAVTLLSTFSSIEGIINASKEELVLCPGLGPQKARRLYDVLHQPFLKSKKKDS